ncbi:hypothetical protein RhiLY_04731 [Ceratobasidium sp. AG-Ba]|nr:hypothetical protein RhiLY_04731 [Ceratobasidium sp. AG-Ba]
MKQYPMFDNGGSSGEDEGDMRTMGMYNKNEPDVLGVLVNSCQIIYSHYLYETLKRQKAASEEKPKAKGEKYVWKQCWDYPDQVAKLRKAGKQRFEFDTSSNFGQHKRKKHDAWSQLELKMNTKDLNMFKCVGCAHQADTVVKIFNHLQKNCPEKKRYTPLHKQHKSGQNTVKDNTVAEQDCNWVKNVDVLKYELLPDLEDNPNLKEFGAYSALEIQDGLEHIVRAVIDHAGAESPQPVKAKPAGVVGDVLHDLAGQLQTGAFGQFMEEYGEEMMNVIDKAWGGKDKDIHGDADSKDLDGDEDNKVEDKMDWL